MPGQFRVKKLWLAKCTCLNVDTLDADVFYLEHLLTRVNLNVFKFEFEHFYLDTCELEHFYLDMCELEHFWYIRSLPTLTENQIQIFEINIVSSIVIFVDLG